MYKNQRAPIIPVSGYKNIILIISNIALVDKGSFISIFRVMTIKLVINDIVKKGMHSLYNLFFINSI